MTSRDFPLRQSGIYRNLPTFDDSIKGLTAIICGATGISGFHTMRALLDTPERWSKIYAVSRKPLTKEMMSLLSPNQQSRVKHISVDLLTSAEAIAEIFKSSNVTADYAFFYSFLEPKWQNGVRWSNAEELSEVNAKLLENFLQALPLADIAPRRILLQTGTKNYGMHVGRVRLPMVESDPQPRHLGPNFYYPQEDLLHEHCKAHPKTSWNVIRPNIIIGAISFSQTNALQSFAFYAAIQAHKNEPLVFGGDFDAWQYEHHHSSARLTGYMSEWAVLEPSCANQAFNAHDGGPTSWDRFFSELARWFDVKAGIKHPSGTPEERASMTDTVVFNSPKDTALGYGSVMEFKQSFRLVDWAVDPQNHRAWKEIMASAPPDQPITFDPFASGDPTECFFGDYGYYRFGLTSMNKARRYGWTGFVDTAESIFEMYVEMAKMGLLPPMKVDAAKPFI